MHQKYNMTKQLNIAAKLQWNRNLHFFMLQTRRAFVPYNISTLFFIFYFIFYFFLFQAQSMTSVFGISHMGYVMEKLYNLSESLFYFVLLWFQLFIVN